MKLPLDMLKKDEQVSLSLRKRYEQRGYKKYKMSKFEEYALYAENRHFLTSEQIITFHDLNGKLLALKPDVTLSIVKNTNAQATGTEKLYYIENVFRLSKQDHEYKEINQMGLEVIGRVDLFATLEVLRLALDSLHEITEEFVLDLSHMGFIGGLLDSTGAEQSVKEKILVCLRTKNQHDLAGILEEAGIDAMLQDKLQKLVALSGKFADTIDAAQELVVNDAMQAALNELKSAYAGLAAHPLAENIRLDFSIVNHIQYYNGIIFRGYVKRIPKAVLAGGRYDLLLKRFGKDAQAIGFALYLDELSRYYPAQRAFDVDAVVLYEASADQTALQAVVQSMNDQGMSVLAGTSIPPELRYKKKLVFENGSLQEVETNA